MPGTPAGGCGGGGGAGAEAGRGDYMHMSMCVILRSLFVVGTHEDARGRGGCFSRAFFINFSFSIYIEWRFYGEGGRGRGEGGRRHLNCICIRTCMYW